MNGRHHAFVIEAEAEEGIAAAMAWAESELGMRTQANPDIVVSRHGLLTVEEARRITELAAGTPFAGAHRAVIIAASRAYHEAQNALLKLFEEPPPGIYLFLVIPSLGGLLPTLRSRVQVLKREARTRSSARAKEESAPRETNSADEFLKMSREKRTALIKRLASGRDEEERRKNREQAIRIVNGVEAALRRRSLEEHAATLSDIAAFRGYMYDRSAPVRMILEHLSIVTPKNVL